MADKMMRMAGRGEDGTAKGMAVDKNGSLYVNQFGKEYIQESQYKTLETTGSETTVFTIYEPVIIDRLVWATNSPKGQIRLMEFKNNTFVATPAIILPNGSGGDGWWASRIVDYKDDFWNIHAYDETAKEFKFSAKRMLYFPKGFRVIVQNNDTAAIKIGVRLEGRRM